MTRHLSIAALALFACGDDAPAGTDTAQPTDSDTTVAETSSATEVVDDTSATEVVDDTSVATEVVEDTSVATEVVADTTEDTEVVASTPFGCIADPDAFDRVSAATVTWKVRLVDPATDTPWSGALVRACRRHDDACEDELAEVVTTADGLVELTVPGGSRGFEGYFEVSGSGLQSTLIVSDPPLATSAVAATDVAILASGALAAAASAAGVAFQSNLAHARVQMLDCAGLPVAGVGVFFAGGFIGGTTKTWYQDMVAGSPATTASGLAGGFNLAAGETVANGRVRAMADARYGRSAMPLRGGWLTVSAVHPSQLAADFTCEGDIPNEAERAATLTYHFVDESNGDPLVGLTVALCASSGPCATPLATTTSDADGSGTFALPQDAGGFVGSLAIGGASVMPHRLDLRPPFTLSVVAFGVGLWTTTVAQSFATLAGAPFDATRGHVVLFVSDCRGEIAVGVTATASSADGGSKTVYVDGALPDTSLTATTADGRIALLNLPVGDVTITGFDHDGVAFGTLVVPVTAGTISLARLIPTPP